MTDPEERSYGLDAVLTKEKLKGKLKFEEADMYVGLAWHEFMTKNYKPEYIVYNIFDCLAMLELDNKTKDLQSTLPDSSGNSDFIKFKSEPARIVDDYYTYLEDKGLIMGTVGKDTNAYVSEVDQDVDEDQDDPIVLDLGFKDPADISVLGSKGWIVNLASYLSVLGLPIFTDDPNIRSGLRAYGYDSDAVAAYPSVTDCLNVSKTTTKKELINIPIMQESLFRNQNINLTSGQVNGIDYCNMMMKFPTPLELLRSYDAIQKETCSH
jgi:hypothetical protein